MKAPVVKQVTVRLPLNLWRTVKARAASEGRTLQAILTDVLATYLVLPTVQTAERALILRAQSIHGNNTTAIAKDVGLSRRTIYRRLKTIPQTVGGD